ncbi:phytanoyl-CoA dioxygenase family protein, partial [Acinetobacter baumannii]|nr:phytanoyl-CoA dioxygenase family protein [Acinetobacter baumannii]
IKNKFNDDGYIHLSSFFDEKIISNITPILNKYHLNSQMAHKTNLLTSSDLIKLKNFLLDDRILQIASNIMGANIRLSFAEYSQTNYEEPKLIWKKYMYDSNGLGFHRDGAFLNLQQCCGDVAPIYSLKFAFWLSNTNINNAGNMYIIPGSHLWSDTYNIDEVEPLSIKARIGDVTLFDRRIYHSRSPNLSKITRKVLFIEFSYRWLRRKMEISINSYTLDKLKSTDLQILGDTDNPWDLYWPEGDLPLEKYLMDI